MNLTANLILNGLLCNAEYTKRVIPFLKNEYFDAAQLEVFKLIKGYINKYNNVPSQDAVQILVENSELPEKQFDEVCDLLNEVYKYSPSNDQQWMFDETEKFCKERALHNAISKVIGIYNKDDINTPPSAIPTILSEALSVQFDNSIGLDYFNDVERQLQYYINDDVKFKFDIDVLNKITAGGIPNKTLNIFLAGINVGKSIWLCHQCAHWLSKGKNVLFISMEMAEENIRHRVDANLLQTDMNDIERKAKQDPEWYRNAINNLRRKTSGTFKVKEYPAGEANVGHFRRLLDELKTKQGFVPDMIAIDYIGICGCQKLKMATTGNSNTYYTEVAKELHALAKEYDLPIWTAHQLNRGAQSSSDAGMDDIADAIGISATADFMLVGLSNEEFEEEGRILLKQIKNRYNTKTELRRVMVGLDRAKMTYYDVDNTSDATDTAHKMLGDDAVEQIMSQIQKQQKTSVQSTDFTF